MQFTTLLVITSTALATVEAANAQSVAQTLADFGLIGTWATDCSQPASHIVYATKSSGDMSRIYYDQTDHVFNNYRIVSANRQGADMLALTLVWDLNSKPAEPGGDRANVVLNMVDGKFQVVSSQGSDGSYFVKDRKITRSGMESPWQQHCR